MSNINKSIDKAQSEAAAIQTQGVKTYIWSRRVTMNLAVFLITVVSAFVVGVIVGW